MHWNETTWYAHAVIWVWVLLYNEWIGKTESSKRWDEAYTWNEWTERRKKRRGRDERREKNSNSNSSSTHSTRRARQSQQCEEVLVMFVVEENIEYWVNGIERVVHYCQLTSIPRWVCTWTRFSAFQYIKIFPHFYTYMYTCKAYYTNCSENYFRFDDIESTAKLKNFFEF